MNACRKILFVTCVAFVGTCPVLADDDVIGMWSSTVRSRGGLGPQWVFSKDGNVSYSFGALIDFKYEINGSEINMATLSPDHTTTKESWIEEFSIDGNMLTINPRKPHQKQIMKRAGNPYTGVHPIVGDWTYMYKTGVPAQMRYSREGIVQLAVPFPPGIYTGTYRRNQDKLSISLRKLKPVIMRYRRDKNLLVLTDSKAQESKYLKFEY